MICARLRLAGFLQLGQQSFALDFLLGFAELRVFQQAVELIDQLALPVDPLIDLFQFALVMLAPPCEGAGGQHHGGQDNQGQGVHRGSRILCINMGGTLTAPRGSVCACCTKSTLANY